jgi:aminoglycoside 2'-N-acetyltransferase I
VPGTEGPGREAAPLSSTSLIIERSRSGALGARLADAVQRLCDAAYETATQRYIAALGPAEHLLGMQSEQLVSHLMWVTRWLQPDGHRPLKTAYVEMVATAPDAQRRGYASALLRHFVPLVDDYDLAALCPATDSLYLRLDWRYWRGPLSARKDGHVVSTPEERVMIMPLPRTPALDLDAPLSVEWRPGEVW